MIERFTVPLGRAAASFFVDHGFVVVPALLGADDLETLRAEVSRFERREYPVVGFDGAPPPAGEALLAVHFPHWVSAPILATITDPRIAALPRRLAGAHLPYWDGSVKCMQSMLFVKPPGMPGQAWHQDERYIATRDRSLIGIWIALDDSTADNGCLWVLPGSHQRGYLWPTRPHGEPEEFDFADESHGFDASGEIPVEVKAGSVVCFNGYLLHRSRRNRGSLPRRALVHHYCNAWSLLPWGGANLTGRIPASTIATFDNRCVVPVGDDPYAWKGYESSPGRVYVRPRTSGDA